MNENLLDDFTVEPRHADDTKVAAIQGRHGLIPVTEPGAQQLIHDLKTIFDLDGGDS